MSARSCPAPRVLATGLVALLSLLGIAWVWRDVSDGSWVAHQLESRFARTPLRATDAFRVSLPDKPAVECGQATVTADMRGDGRSQVLRSRNHGIAMVDHDGRAIRFLDQFNLPPEFSRREPYAALLAPYDADGDGRSEVVAVAPRHDLSEWRLWVLDIDAQLIKGEMVLPHGPDRRRPDGVWDGQFEQVAALPVPGLPHPAVLLVCHVRFDVDGRGVLAVDPLAGEVLWYFEMGGVPQPLELVLADLDHDGVPEIVLGTTSPNNLTGELINHTSDDSSRVFVLGADGELRWTRTLGGAHDAASLATVDVTGDGTPEIVTVAANPTGPSGRLSVWSASGDLLFDEQKLTRRPYRVRSLAASEDESPVIMILNSDHWLESFRWADRGLKQVSSRRLEAGAHAFNVIDDLAAHAGDLLVGSEPERVRLFDGFLRTQAIIPTEIRQLRVPALVWQARADQQFLLLPGATNFIHRLEARPLIPAWSWLAAVAFSLLLAMIAGRAASSVQHRRRRRLHGGPVETDPAVLRAMRREILGLLQKGGHEKIGVLKALRRVVWNLDAAVSVSAAPPPAGETASPAVRRALDAAEAFRRESLPLLREVVSLSRRAGVAPHVAATCADILAEVERLLTAPDLASRSCGDVLTEVARLNQEAEVGFQRLRRAVEESFCCSLPRAVIRVLDAQAEALRAGGVVVEIDGGDSADGAPWVHIDPPDLEFILDNLVGNAVRAMAAAPRKVLRVGWTVRAGQINVTVSDTGWGVEPEDWECIFELSAAGRPGRGLGLARSRHELGIYGGSLRVLASQPGRGTTFELRLPPARMATTGDVASRMRLVERQEGA